MANSDLTIGILCRDRDPLVENAIASVLDLGRVLLLCSGTLKSDFVGHDEVALITHVWDHNFSHARNKLHELCSTPWIFHLDSDETLDPTSILVIHERISGPPEILKVSVMQENSRVLLPRLMPSTVRWQRPAHEIPVGPDPVAIEERVLIRHFTSDKKTQQERQLYKVRLIEEEFKRTRDPDLLFLCAIDYTFLNLTKARYYAHRFLNEFGGAASEKIETQSLLMEYTLAYLDGMSREDLPGAIRRLRRLIARRVDYAELWCLLGDLYFILGAHRQAIEMFENAIALGNYTPFLKENRLWLEMEKYDEYPRGRIVQCNEILEARPRGNTG